MRVRRSSNAMQANFFDPYIDTIFDTLGLSPYSYLNYLPIISPSLFLLTFSFKAIDECVFELGFDGK